MTKRSWFAFLLLALSCAEPASPEARSHTPTSAAPDAPAAPAKAPAPEPPRVVVVDTLPVPGDQPVFALRGGRKGGAVGVMLHGWCSHGMGFLQAFQWAAADVGQFIALQGDHHCGSGPMRGWGNDVVALDRRIDAALRAYLGAEPPVELVLVGSSQGVDRAVDLARRFPTKYRWLVLASGPQAIPARGLQQLAGGYFFVGQYEGRGPMQRATPGSEQAFERS